MAQPHSSCHCVNTAWSGCRSKRRAPSATNRHNLSLGSLLHCLLLHGEGLWVGPDSDGLLNICDDEQLRYVHTAL